MSNQLDSTVEQLRMRVLAGDFPADGKLRESTLSEDAGVSRTLVRLALAELEREGLVQRIPNRGYRVRRFSLDEVSEAILVRGELEAMAARLCAEKGLEPSVCEDIDAILGEMSGWIEDGFDGDAERQRWIAHNVRFHHAITAACGNWAIGRSIEQLARIPLVSCSAIVFDLGMPARSLDGIRRAQDDHLRVFDAIRAGQGERAAGLMREHALASSRNKRRSIDAMRAGRLGPSIPGLALVA